MFPDGPKWCDIQQMGTVQEESEVIELDTLEFAPAGTFSVYNIYFNSTASLLYRILQGLSIHGRTQFTAIDLFKIPWLVYIIWV